MRKMPIARSCLVSIILALIPLCLSAQSEQSVDTLVAAHHLNLDGDFHQAAQMLRAYQQDHADFESLRMLAETLFWMEDLHEARQAYKDALRRFPEQFRVHLEIARVMFAQDSLNDARRHLELFLQSAPGHAEGNYLIGVTYYWQGQYARAINYFRRTLEIDAQYVQAEEILRDLQIATAPTLTQQFSYATDDQPLDELGVQTVFRMYRSTLFSPQLRLEGARLMDDAPAFRLGQIHAANTFTLWQARMQIALGAGLVITDNDEGSTDVLWSAALNKEFSDHFSTDLSANRRPYTWTIRSLDSIHLYNTYRISLQRIHSAGIQFQIAYDHWQLRSNLHSATAYAWILSPPLHLGAMQLSAGYSYSYSDANSNLFVPVMTVGEVIQNYDSTESIKGIYDPFYTPEENHMHALIGSIAIGHSGRFQVKLNGSIAIHAIARNPYFYLDNEEGKIVIRKDFYQQEYTPFTIECQARWTASPRIAIYGGYRFMRSLFYDQQRAQLGVEIKFVEHAR